MPSLPLPRFGFDEQNYAVLVAGRYLSPEVLRSRGHVKELEAFVRALAEKTALPLAFVYLGTTINWTLEGDDDNPADPDVAALIGLVIAYATGEQPVALAHDALDPSQPDRVPAALWSDLETQHAVRFGGHGDSAFEEGIYLAPSGWSLGCLYAGTVTSTCAGGRIVDGVMVPRLTHEVKGSKLVMVASEEIPACKRLDIGKHAALLASASPLVLVASYA